MRALVALCLFTATVHAADPPITAVAFTPDGRAVLLGSQNGLELRAWPELKPGKKIACTLTHIHDLAFAPDGKQLLVAGGTPGEEGRVELLSWPDGKLLRHMTAGDDVVQAVAWHADSKQWACAGLDGHCRVFATSHDKPSLVFAGHSRSVLALIYLPGSKQIVSAGRDNSLRVWDTRTGKTERTLDNHTQPVTALALRPTKVQDALPLLASGGLDRTVRLWQPTIGRLVRFVRLPSPVHAVAWTADGTHIVAGCQDGQVRVIDAEELIITHTDKALKGWIYSLSVLGDELLCAGATGQLRRLSLK